MKNLTREEASFEAHMKFRGYIAQYGLRNAQRIVLELARLLRKEKTRREENPV